MHSAYDPAETWDTYRLLPIVSSVYDYLGDTLDRAGVGKSDEGERDERGRSEMDHRYERVWLFRRNG